MKDNILKSTLLAGFFLLFFIFYNIFISTLFFIFKVSISKYYAIVALVLSIMTIVFLLKKIDLLSIKKYYCIIISIIAPILIIIISVFLNGKIVDFSYDGNHYHKATVGLMKNGWNPLYEDARDFDQKQDQPIYISERIAIWVDHYARASHIYQANIYALTGNIECGKSINTLSIILMFLIIFSIMALKIKKIIFPLLSSICVVTYSVISAQFLTNYIDLLNYIFLTLLIFTFFIFEFRENKKQENIGLLLYFICLLLCINIKFTTFAYAGLFCLGFYIYYIIKLIKKKIDKKFFIKFTTASFIGVIVGVFVVGLAVYPKNFVTNGNPFYPLFGENKEDIITTNQPDYFKEKSSIEKYFISMFAKSANIQEYSGDKATLKIPFTVDSEELNAIKTTDTRMSGNGVLFSGIFILSILIICLTSYKIFKEHKGIFILCSIILGITILFIVFLGESWWARYFPQTYFIALIALLYLWLLKNKITKSLSYLFIIIILINNLITFNEAINYSYDLNMNAKMQYQYMLDTTGGNVYIITEIAYPGIYYNIQDDLEEYNYTILPPKKSISLDEYQYLLSGLAYYRPKE